jgi:hypothetical protein
VQPDAAVGRAVLSSALAVLAVVLLVVALLAFFGHAVNPGEAAGPVATGTPGRPEAVPATPSAPGRSGAQGRPAAPKAPADNGAPTESPDSPEVPDIGVVVLNQSTREGLAAEVARDLKAAGWRVTDTGNWRGSVPETTVYYPRGFATAAETLAAALKGVGRTRPRQSNMPVGVLTVILHDSYRR